MLGICELNEKLVDMAIANWAFVYEGFLTELGCDHKDKRGSDRFENPQDLVDNERGSILVAANEDTRLEDFVKITLEDYGVDFAENDVELRYLLPKQNQHKQSIDTPPVKIGNDRQFYAFLGLCKVENDRLCVEFKVNRIGGKGAVEDQKQPIQGDEPLCEDEEDTDEEDDRFDYCDDSDGATSDDENFTTYGIPPDHVEEWDRVTPTADSLNSDTTSSPTASSTV
ncbi:hypothetical protein DY000_02045845 [Brassica cretica]|uniref:Uncharacterized protein n=1 Tax=Brassica cretica TaxID=69181 RepID=A0ABQ7F1D6_BRACR|nr:hypothetical protein DY000_02045845 [Brassica cretica]